MWQSDQCGSKIFRVFWCDLDLLKGFLWEKINAREGCEEKEIDSQWVTKGYNYQEQIKW